MEALANDIKATETKQAEVQKMEAALKALKRTSKAAVPPLTRCPGAQAIGRSKT